MGKKPFFRLSLLISLVFALDVFAVTVFQTTVAEIVKNPDKFNQGQVIVQGKAVNIKRYATHQGSPYTIFFLLDRSSGDKLVVEYLPGVLDLQESSLVTVEGFYYKKPKPTPGRLGGFTNWIRANYVK